MKKVRPGQRPSASEQNRLIDAATSMLSSNHIQGFVDSTGFHTRRTPIDIAKLAGAVRLAYCKTDAGAATTIVCYLDTDATGAEITVECDIAGGGNLNAATPRLTDGLAMPVVDIDGTWYSLFPFQATEDCDCSPGNTVSLSAVGPTDNLNVSGLVAVFIDTSANNVTLGGTVNGVDGQVLHIAVDDATNNFTLEHNEGTGNQDFILHAGADEIMTAEHGGWVFVNHGGNHWHVCSHAKHV